MRTHAKKISARTDAFVLPRYDEIALVLQGGGALGSYQAGVVEGLAEAKVEPDWIAGVSIGALNTAIIAGNPPEKRIEAMRGFWNAICHPLDWMGGVGAWALPGLGQHVGGRARVDRRATRIFRAALSFAHGRHGQARCKPRQLLRHGGA
jgi:NTE family protein